MNLTSQASNNRYVMNEFFMPEADIPTNPALLSKKQSDEASKQQIQSKRENLQPKRKIFQNLINQQNDTLIIDSLMKEKSVNQGYIEAPTPKHSKLKTKKSKIPSKKLNKMLFSFGDKSEQEQSSSQQNNSKENANVNPQFQNQPSQKDDNGLKQINANNDMSSAKNSKFKLLHSHFDFDEEEESSEQKQSACCIFEEKCCINSDEEPNHQPESIEQENCHDPSKDSTASSKSSSKELEKSQIKVPKINKKMLFAQEDFEDSQDNSDFKSQKIVTSNSHQGSKACSSPAVSDSISTSTFIRQFVRNRQTENYDFLKVQIPQDRSVEFILKRNRPSKQNKQIEYHLHDSKSLSQLLIVRKQGIGYEIWAKSNVQNVKKHPKQEYLVAGVQKSFFGNEFSLRYSKEDNRKLINHGKDPNKHQIRMYEENFSCTVEYETNVLGLNGPRKMLISLHNKCLNQEEKTQRFVNKPARWNQATKAYTLNMEGKAKMSSVKNFVILREQSFETLNESMPETKHQSHIVFGKNSSDLFTLMIRGPFNILQGVLAALSSFQRKITCE